VEHLLYYEVLQRIRHGQPFKRPGTSLVCVVHAISRSSNAKCVYIRTKCRDSVLIAEPWLVGLGTVAYARILVEEVNAHDGNVNCMMGCAEGE